VPKRHVETQEQIGLKITGTMCSLNYVKCITVKTTLGSQLINVRFVFYRLAIYCLCVILVIKSEGE
jgi:hypothetical protein